MVAIPDWLDCSARRIAFEGPKQRTVLAPGREPIPFRRDCVVCETRSPHTSYYCTTIPNILLLFRNLLTAVPPEICPSCISPTFVPPPTLLTPNPPAWPLSTPFLWCSSLYAGPPARHPPSVRPISRRSQAPPKSSKLLRIFLIHEHCSAVFLLSEPCGFI